MRNVHLENRLALLQTLRYLNTLSNTLLTLNPAITPSTLTNTMSELLTLWQMKRKGTYKGTLDATYILSALITLQTTLADLTPPTEDTAHHFLKAALIRAEFYILEGQKPLANSELTEARKYFNRLRSHWLKGGHTKAEYIEKVSDYEATLAWLTEQRDQLISSNDELNTPLTVPSQKEHEIQAYHFMLEKLAICTEITFHAPLEEFDESDKAGLFFGILIKTILTCSKLGEIDIANKEQHSQQANAVCKHILKLYGYKIPLTKTDEKTLEKNDGFESEPLWLANMYLKNSVKLLEDKEALAASIHEDFPDGLINHFIEKATLTTPKAKERALREEVIALKQMVVTLSTGILIQQSAFQEREQPRSRTISAPLFQTRASSAPPHARDTKTHSPAFN